MNKVMDFMGKDHDRLDALFKEFQKNHADMRKAHPFFHEFKIGLQRHIIWEEEVLFPLFENNTGMHDSGPTAVLRMEHVQIKDWLEKLHDKVRAGDSSGIEALESGLISVLSEHNDKEESVLYPWIDNSLSQKDVDAAFERMKLIPPDAYRCCHH